MTTPAPRCPMCAADRAVPRFTHGTYTIFACRACRGGFAWPRPRPDELDDVYDEAYASRYAAGTMNEVEFGRERFQRLEKSLRKLAPRLLDGSSGRLLDVGCASGRLAREFLDRGWRAEGVEFLPRLAEQARLEGIAVHVGDFTRLELRASSYDLITMFHVIEHFEFPLDAAVKCRDLLRPGGLLVLETPNWRGIGALLRGSRWSHIIPPEHLSYFGPSALRELVLRAGFSSARARTVTPQVIAAVAPAPWPVRLAVRGTYGFATLLGFGTTLQVFAFTDASPGDRDGERAR